MEHLPVFELQPLLDSTAASCSNPSPVVQELCQQMAACLHRTSCLVVRDPRVSTEDSDTFLDMMEQYFGRSPEEKAADVRPGLHYQVGATPGGTETPRILVDTSLQQQFQALTGPNAGTLPQGPDPKWRYLWRVGDRPEATQYQELNAEPVMPQGFSQWQQVMDCWGGKLLGTALSVAGAVAQGLGLPADAFTSRMHHGPHLLAPTGSDLAQHGALGTVFAGYHYDLNFLTLHGQSRFPGLFVWLRDGQRVAVRIPPGCILIQAGKQMEWLTGGYVQAGMHEVVVTTDTQAAMAAAQAAGRSTWRVSSTVFAHIASDVTLQPLGHFATSPEAAQAYPSIAAGLQVQRELEAIRLKRMETAAVKTSSPMVLSGSASQQQELGKTSSLEPLAGGEGVGLHNNSSSQALRRLVSSDGGNNIACVAIH